MITLPLFQTGSSTLLTPMEQSVINTEMLITSLMMQATLKEDLSEMERETYTILSVSLIEPANA
jgi:hypothetical protein